MIAQFVSFLFCSFCFFTIGALLKKLTKWSISYYIDFLVGLAATNGLFTFISILYPINDIATLLFVSTLTILLFINRRWLRTYYEGMYKKIKQTVNNSPIIFSVICVFIIITFFQSLYSPALHYDAALYHVPSIMWAEKYPAIQGLVHLNIFFGYNFNIFPLYAIFSLNSLFHQPIYSINFTLVFFFSIWIFSEIDKATSKKYFLYSICFLLILYYFIENFWIHVSTPSNDIAVYILLISILLSLIKIDTNKDIIFPILILSIYCITVKLSAGPILLVTLYILILRHYWTYKRKALISTVLSALILIPWLIKNVIITGWLLFPFPYIDLFSFDWKVPIEYVIHQKEIIKDYYIPIEARNSFWLKAWLVSQTKMDLAIIVTTSVALLVLVVQLLLKRIAVKPVYIMAIVVSITGIAFMFMNSPSLRYCIAFFLSAISLSVNAFSIKNKLSEYTFYTLSTLVIVLFLKTNWFHPWHFAKNISDRLLVPYPLVALDTKRFNYFMIDNKIKCYYPLDTDQCYDQALPCTSYKSENIHLRGKSVEQGFYTSLSEKLK